MGKQTLEVKRATTDELLGVATDAERMFSTTTSSEVSLYHKGAW